jgi:hypothetical protein
MQTQRLSLNSIEGKTGYLRKRIILHLFASNAKHPRPSADFGKEIEYNGFCRIVLPSIEFKVRRYVCILGVKKIEKK